MVDTITLRDYLSNSHPIKKNSKERVHSCLTTALRETRMITGRSVKTGRVLKKVDPKCKDCTIGYPGHLLGAVGYLLILDQIGSCFRLKNAKKPSTENKIVAALEHFAPLLTNEERWALFALRCSLAHDFNLLNRSKGLKTHKFELTIDPKHKLIKLPIQNWDPKKRSKSKNVTTIINVKRLGDLVEDIVKKLRKFERMGKLKIILPKGIKGLRKGYLIWVKN